MKVKVNPTGLELALQSGGEIRLPIFEGQEVLRFGDDFPHVSVPLLPFTIAKGIDYSYLKILLEDAVMASVGRVDKAAILLSGGVDSSLLLRLIRDVCPHVHITAFHTVFGIPERDELKYAEIAAKHAGVPLKVINTDPLSQIPIIQEALRETMTPSYSIGTVYKAFKVIKNSGYDTVINALGLDELFSGYTIHKRYFGRKKKPKIIPFRKTSSKYYRYASLLFGTTKSFILNSIFKDPSLSLVHDSEVDPDQFFKMLDKRSEWYTIQNLTLESMASHFATLMWRCASVLEMNVIFPYIKHGEFMQYALTLDPNIKYNKAPIRHMMRYLYSMPEENVSKGENWDKIGWGGVFEPYFQCKNFMKALEVERPSDLPVVFNEKTAGKWWTDAFANNRPNRIAIQMAMIRKIMELCG